MNDSLGDRMKDQYENRTRYFVPRRTYTIIRIDGKSFHTFTRKFEKPFDNKLTQAMDNTTKYLVENIQGCCLGYVQSDEISLLLTDFTKEKTSAWFDGNIQKMCSVAAGMTSVFFAKDVSGYTEELPVFDARVFTIPDVVEVKNYFIWRQKDWERNSVNMLARSLYSHKELMGKSVKDMHEMIHDKGKNWAKLDSRYKNGCAVFNDPCEGTVMTSDMIFSKSEKFSSIIPEYGYGR